MNKELIIEALQVLRKTIERNMDANDAHFSTFFVSKLSDIDDEIANITDYHSATQTKYDNSDGEEYQFDEYDCH